MQIDYLAKQTGVSRDTLRFSEALGLSHAERRDNGSRDHATVLESAGACG